MHKEISVTSKCFILWYPPRRTFFRCNDCLKSAYLMEIFYNCSSSLKISFTSKIFHFRFNGSFLPRLTSKMTSTDLVTSFLTFVWWFDLTMILISLYSVSFQFILWCLLLFIVSSISEHWKHQTKNADFRIFSNSRWVYNPCLGDFTMGKHGWVDRSPESFLVRKLFGPYQSFRARTRV